MCLVYNELISSPGVFSVGTDGLSAFVMEGDSVTLHTNVETKQQIYIKWYFNDTRIAQSLEISVLSVQMFSVMKVLRDSETD